MIALRVAQPLKKQCRRRLKTRPKALRKKASAINRPNAMLNDETNDNYWMAQALECAERSLFLSAPNPRVGCVIVQNNALVAQGFTQQRSEERRVGKECRARWE